MIWKELHRYLASFLHVGSFVIIDLIAATTNALNGALLVSAPGLLQGQAVVVIGILLLAIFGGIGGGVSRDVLLNKVPGALTNPWYLILCILAGLVGMLISYKGGQKFRETFYQFMTAFSLPWYAAIGARQDSVPACLLSPLSPSAWWVRRPAASSSTSPPATGRSSSSAASGSSGRPC